MKNSAKLHQDLQELSSPEKAASSAWFFKTGPGQYGEGDVFMGVSVPNVRKVAKRHQDTSLEELEELLKSKVHEERQIALFILVDQYKCGDEAKKEAIYNFYLSHSTWVNNWDLVDCSAEFIVGPWLENKDKSILTKLALSESLWERRIAMLATFHYIKKGEPTEALAIAALLLQDKHDLIQKAVGWMLREVGKRCSPQIEEEFLLKNYQNMPRTMLRYAIEHFPEERRQAYLKGRIN